MVSLSFSFHQTRLDALMMTLSVGYLLPWPRAGGRGQGRPQESPGAGVRGQGIPEESPGAGGRGEGRPQESPGARRIAAGSRRGDEEREGEVGAELVGRWVE